MRAAMPSRSGHMRMQPPSRVWRLYRPAIWLLAGVGAACWAVLSPHDVSWRAVLILSGIGIIFDMAAVRIQDRMRVSTAHFAAPFATVVSGGLAGVITAAAILAGRLLLYRRDWNWFDIAVNVASASIAGLVWTATKDMGSGLAAAVAVVLVFAIIRSTINWGWTKEARAKGIIIPPISAQISKLMLANALLFAPAVGLYLVQRPGSLESLALLALPFIATQFTTQAYGRETRLNHRLERTNLNLTESLVNALDARDPYSAGHSVAVAVYARDIAAEMGLSPEHVHRMYLAGLLHDIGKIAVPDAILCKPAALTDDEFEEIKKHPVIGEQILAPNEMLAEILPSVRHHHERIDGRGYPDSLAGERIPLDARIIAVADAYNAMTSTRPYRDAMAPKLAIHILRQNQGMQHDSFIVGAFVRVLERQSDEYAVARGSDFATSTAMVDLIAATQARIPVPPTDAAAPPDAKAA